MKYHRPHVHSPACHRFKKVAGSIRKLEDIAFYLDDPKVPAETCDQPVKGVSELTISISSEVLISIFSLLFPVQDDADERKKSHYWLDASFILAYPSVYGRLNGETYRISKPSLINAYLVGLGMIDQEYELLWKRFNGVSHIFDNHLERIINRSDVTVPPEIALELAKKIRWGIGKMEHVSPSYKRVLERRYETQEKLVRRIEEKIMTDSTFSQVTQNGFVPYLDQCKKIAEEHRINTSEVDNRLIAYALANAAIQRGQLQIVLTGDFGIADVINIICSSKNNNLFSVRNEYYKPLKINALRIKA